MKAIIISALVVLTGCASVKKTFTHIQANSDSLVTVQKDTTSRVSDVEKTQNIELQDVDFTIHYSNGDSVKKSVPKVVGANKGKTNPVDEELKDAIASFNYGHSQITEVDAHIGDVRDVVDYSDKVDSQSVKSKTVNEVKKSTVTDIKTVARTMIPIWVWFALAGLVLIGLVKLVLKFKIFGL